MTWPCCGSSCNRSWRRNQIFHLLTRTQVAGRRFWRTWWTILLFRWVGIRLFKTKVNHRGPTPLRST